MTILKRTRQSFSEITFKKNSSPFLFRKALEAVQDLHYVTATRIAIPSMFMVYDKHGGNSEDFSNEAVFFISELILSKAEEEHSFDIKRETEKIIDKGLYEAIPRCYFLSKNLKNTPKAWNEYRDLFFRIIMQLGVKDFKKSFRRKDFPDKNELDIFFDFYKRELFSDDSILPPPLVVKKGRRTKISNRYLRFLKQEAFRTEMLRRDLEDFVSEFKKSETIQQEKTGVSSPLSSEEKRLLEDFLLDKYRNNGENSMLLSIVCNPYNENLYRKALEKQIDILKLWIYSEDSQSLDMLAENNLSSFFDISQRLKKIKDIEKR